MIAIAFGDEHDPDTRRCVYVGSIDRLPAAVIGPPLIPDPLPTLVTVPRPDTDAQAHAVPPPFIFQTWPAGHNAIPRGAGLVPEPRSVASWTTFWRPGVGTGCATTIALTNAAVMTAVDIA
jgi:hypothetical protein